MLTVTDSNFSDVLAAPMAVVDFWSPSCPHCMQFKPIFEDVAGSMGDKILFVAANVNDNMQSAGKFNIAGIPAVIFLQNGKEVRRFEGATDKADFVNEINAAFGSGAQTGVPSAATGTPAGAPSSGGAPVLGGIVLAGVLAGVAYLIFRK
jgi:thioredoxin 1